MPGAVFKPKCNKKNYALKILYFPKKVSYILGQMLTKGKAKKFLIL